MARLHLLNERALLTVPKSRPHNYILLFVGSFAKEVL